MKKAVVVVGSHYAGKSKTINLYLKPKLQIGKYGHKFSLGGDEGIVLSQSREEAVGAEGFVKSQTLEEAGNCADVTRIVQKYSGYRLLVLAARPSNEPTSCLKQLKSELKSAGYEVNILNVIAGQSERYYRDGAAEILSHLIS